MTFVNELRKYRSWFQADSLYLEAVREIQQHILRRTNVSLAVVLTLILITSAMANVEQVPVNGTAAFLLVLFGYLAHRFIERSNLLAVVCLHAGLGSAVTLLSGFYGRPELSLLLLPLPFITALTVGRIPAALDVVVVTWWAGLLTRSSFTWFDAAHPVTWVLGGGIFVLLTGTAAAHEYFSSLDWYIGSYRESRRYLEEARDQLLEINQVREDLVLANRELMRLTERLKAMTTVAELALRAKEEFVANVSHEFRTPLNMIIGFTETITRSPWLYGGKLPKKLLNDLLVIQRNGHHLLELVNDVLDLSQIEAGRMAITREWTDLKEVIQAAIEQVRPLFQAKALYLEAELPDGQAAVFCDATRIREVLINLLSNAGRLTERGGVQIRVMQSDEGYTVSVRDTGPGIRKEDLERIFEPFQQLDNSIRRKHSGSGLGLSICQKFIELHEGKLWVESEFGRGSTFYFSLPHAISSATEGVHTVRWISPEYEYKGRQRKYKAPIPEFVPRYVVFETNRALSSLLERYLNRVEVTTVHSVHQALHELGRSPVQALIINMAGNHEAEISDLVQKSPFGTVILQCYVPGYEDYARQLDVFDYLVKPSPIERVMDTFRRLDREIQSVLIVDDEPEQLQLYSRMIESFNHNCRLLYASNGIEALRMLRQFRPDLCLLDLVMPEMDGFAVLQAIKQEEELAQLPVIIISSRDPNGIPIISNRLTALKGTGLSTHELITSIQALSNLLNPGSLKPGDSTHPENPLS